MGCKCNQQVGQSSLWRMHRITLAVLFHVQVISASEHLRCVVNRNTVFESKDSVALCRAEKEAVKDTYILQWVRLTGSLALALAGQVEDGQGHVMRVKGGQPITVNRGGGVGPQGTGSRQRGPHAATQAIGLALSPLVLNRRL